MARFSGQIHSAKFIDLEEKVVEVLYGADPKSLTPFNVPVDYNSPVFTELLEEVSFEEIQDQTKQYFGDIIDARNNAIHLAATKMFEDWIKNAQEDLDKQDAERYRIFEEYKNAVLETMQLEADKQVLERVNEEYGKIQSIIDEQYAKVQEVVDTQVQERLEKEYGNVQKVIDEQYKQVQAEVDKQADEQVQSRVAEEYQKIDEYKQEQLKKLQKDVDIQIQERYKEVDGYKLQQLEKAREELKKNFNITAPSTVPISTNDLIKAFIKNTEDEDLLFKSKLEIFDKPEVKNNKSRELKMKVRKAKSIPELFAAYQECLT